MERNLTKQLEYMESKLTDTINSVTEIKIIHQKKNNSLEKKYSIECTALSFEKRICK